VALVAVASWVTAPFTGAADDAILDVSPTTIRYLLPALSAAAVALVLAARGGRARSAACVAVLGAGCAWSIAATQSLSVLAIPSTATLATGALAGAAAAALASRRRRRSLPEPHPAAFAAAGVLAALALTAVGHGFAARQGGAHWLRSWGLVTWASTQPQWRDGSFEVAFAPEIIAPLAGDRLQHRIELIAQHEDCTSVAARARRGWVVIGSFEFAERREQFSAEGCLQTAPDGAQMLYRDERFTVFGPRHTATRSNALSTSRSPRWKSSGVISAARGSGAARRLRVSIQS
jgi:hypothetical protein